jgi:Carbohydrate esterase, sialic acid-specific acetylesterase
MIFNPTQPISKDNFPAGKLKSLSQKFRERVNAAGGSIDDPTYNLIVEYLERPLVAAGLVPELSYIFVGSGANTQKVPFTGRVNATPVNCVDGDFTSSGFTGDGSTKYLNLNQSAVDLGLTLDNLTLITYGTNLGGTGTYVHVSATGPGARRSMLYREVDGSFRYDCDDQAVSVAFLVTAVAAGMVAGQSPPDSAYQRIWLDDVPQAYDPAAPRINGAEASTGKFLALAYDNAGSIALHSPGNLRFLAIMRSLTDPQMRLLYRIIDQFNSRLGRSATGNTNQSLIVTTPESYQVFQRDSFNKADIVIEGYYSGSATTIEARWNGGAYVPIATVVRTGPFRGVLTGQSAGQGTLEVRQVNTGNVVSKTFVGVGDIFFCAGQSNSSGQFTNLQTYSHGSLKASMLQKYRGWQELADPTGAYIGGGSVWPRLATRHMADQNVPVAFVCMGVGSTFLANAGQWDKDIGVSFAQARHILKQIGSIPRAILWYQGETDATLGNSGTSYLAALTAMRQAFSDAAGSQIPLMPVQIGYIDPTLSPTTLDGIREAIAQAWNLPNFLWGFPCYDRNLSVGAGGDGLHWRSDADATELSARYWRALKAQLFGGTEGRAPEFLSATFTADQINILTQYGFGTLSLGISGFEVIDANGTRSVINAGSIAGGFSLTVDQALVGPVTISYGKGNAGIGTSIRDNGSITRYYLVPFLNKFVTAAP